VKKRDLFTRYSTQARAVLDALRNKYADEGLVPVEDLGVLRVQPFSDLGTPIELIRAFGGRDGYLAAVRDLERALYENSFVSPLVGVRWIDAGGETHEASDLRWRAWAANPEGTTGDALLAFVNDTLFPALKGLEPGPRVEDDSAAEALRRRRALVKSVF
jgi:hypothetical protein